MKAYEHGRILEAIDEPQYPLTVDVWVPELCEASIPVEVPMFSEQCCDNEGRTL